MNQQMIDHGSYLQVRGLQLGLLRRPTASNRLCDSVALWQVFDLRDLRDEAVASVE
jgi:hypothetical protein